MIFANNGIDFPEQLLKAQQAGEVVFVCGAGVSIQATLGTDYQLPTFKGLAEQVKERLPPELGSSLDSLLKLHLDQVPFSGETTGVDLAAKLAFAVQHLGVDRVFSEFKEEFHDGQVDTAIAQALKPSISRSDYHELIANLSANSQGRKRVITTNFDRLFDPEFSGDDVLVANNSLSAAYNPDWHGLIYLHGRVNEDYSAPDAGGFIICERSFGRAYLTSGWAAATLKALMERFTFVFVGYNADDAPFKYLLTGIDRKANLNIRPSYALLPTSDPEILAQWNSKNVIPLGCSASNVEAGFDALWASIKGWYHHSTGSPEALKVLADIGQRLPEECTQDERTMFFDACTQDTDTLISLLLSEEKCPRLEWLGVLDLRERRKSKKVAPNAEGAVDDVVSSSSLDRPSIFGSVLEVNEGRADGLQVRENFHKWEPQLTGVENHGFRHGFQLSYRQDKLTEWLARQWHNPKLLDWLSDQAGLRAGFVQELCERAIKLSKESGADNADSFSEAFKLIARYFGSAKARRSFDEYEFEKRVKGREWSWQDCQDYARLCSPRVTLERPFRYSFDEKEESQAIRGWQDLVRISLDFQLHGFKISPPPNSSAMVVQSQFLMILEVLETVRTVGHYGLDFENTINTDANKNRHSSSEYWFFTRFLNHWKNWREQSPESADAHRLLWPREEHVVFQRLEILWANDSESCPPEEAEAIFTEVNDQTFWRSRSGSDLAAAVAGRWSEMNTEFRQSYQERVCQGPLGEQLDGEYAQYQIGDRLNLLKSSGCELGVEAERILEDIQRRQPAAIFNETEGKSDYLGMTFGTVKTEKSYPDLAGPEFGEVITKLRDHAEETKQHLINPKPILGFMEIDLSGAWEAIVSHQSGWEDVRKQELYEFLWSHYWGLNDEPLQHDNWDQALAWFSALSDEQIAGSIGDFSWWLSRVPFPKAQANYERYFEFAERLSSLLLKNSDEATSAIISGGDLGHSALNSAPGRLVDFLCIKLGKTKDSLNDRWLAALAQLTSAPDPIGSLATSMASRYTHWFLHNFPDWTNLALLDELPTVEVLGTLPAFWDTLYNGRMSLSKELLDLLIPKVTSHARLAREWSGTERMNIAVLLLRSWGDQFQESACTNSPSSVAFRELLLEAPHELSYQVLDSLNDLARKGDNPDEDRSSGATANVWMTSGKTFFAEVWPKQRRLNSGRYIQQLLEFCLQDEAHFEELYNSILGPIDVDVFVKLPYRLDDVWKEILTRDSGAGCLISFIEKSAQNIADPHEVWNYQRLLNEMSAELSTPELSSRVAAILTKLGRQ